MTASSFFFRPPWRTGCPPITRRASGASSSSNSTCRPWAWPPRPPPRAARLTPPSLLLKIWLDGYFQRLRSTRKLEVACSEPLWLPWLAGRIAPDPNSPGRFWRDHKKAPRAVFKQTVRVARPGGAVGTGLASPRRHPERSRRQRLLRLDYAGHATKAGGRVQRFRCHCRDSPVRAHCTRDPKGRQLEAWPHPPVVQAMRERLKAAARRGHLRPAPGHH